MCWLDVHCLKILVTCELRYSTRCATSLRGFKFRNCVRRRRRLRRKPEQPPGGVKSGAVARASTSSPRVRGRAWNKDLRKRQGERKVETKHPNRLRHKTSTLPVCTCAHSQFHMHSPCVWVSACKRIHVHIRACAWCSQMCMHMSKLCEYYE